MSALVSRLAGTLPPPLRRAAAGLWLDVKSLPTRIRDPSRREDPWQTLHNVGGGDYRLAGEEALGLLKAFADLKSSDAVLDIGCGTGRTATALAGFLSNRASYLGFDVSPTAIATSRRRFGALRPDFNFLEASVINGEYRPRGGVREFEYQFPPSAATIDVAFAISVFSHMRADSIAHYMTEAARVLRPSGRLLFTAYGLTPRRVEMIDYGQCRQAFQPWVSGAYVIDTRSPERAIAHPISTLAKLASDAGLETLTILRGSWLDEPEYGGFQDLIVARPKRMYV